MRHRFIAAILVALGLGATVMLAAERATFVLTSGERISGVVVFHTEARTNIRSDKNEFNIGLANGAEMAMPYSQVAIIDFVGGQPRPEEFNALSETQHLMMLRSGSTRYGHLVDLVNGDTVRWDDSSNGRMELPITQVRRIFLNTERTRDIYNVAPPAPQVAPRAPVGQGSRGFSPVVGSTVVVRGNTPWTDTTIDVQAGQTLRIASTGQVSISRQAGIAADAAGNDQFRNQSFPVPSMSGGALIAKIGANGRAFAIGLEPSVQVNDGGRLFLGVNDTQFDDNSGSFRVTVQRMARAIGNRSQGSMNFPSTNAPLSANQSIVTVPGNVAWTDTGVTLGSGEVFRIAPRGQVNFAAGADTVSGPDGNDNFMNGQFPVPDLPAGALIGRIGPRGRPFAIGSAPDDFSRGAGRLYLGINDTIFTDNSGSFRVTVTRNIR